MSRFAGIPYATIATVVLAALAVPAAAQYTNVDLDTAHTMWQGGVFMLDVRTTAEYQIGHVPGAYNIDVNELASRLDEIDDLLNVDILVYCKAGGRSATASGILVANGYTKVYNMLGGFDAWSGAGYDTEAASDGYDEVDVDDAYRMWEGGALFLDVRTAFQYDCGHVTGAVNIPLDELADRLDELADYLDEDIVVYCSSGTCTLSPQACAILATNGFTLVHDMVDGYEGWTEAGYPAEGTGGIFCCGSVSVPAPPSGGIDGGLLLMACAAAAACVSRLKPRWAA